MSRISTTRAIDADQLPVEIADLRDRIVDPLCLPGEVGIDCANDDPRVSRVRVMQPDEVLPIEREYGSIFRNRESE